MTAKPVYILDTNVFIEAKNRYYAFAFAPIFWESLIVRAGSRQIESIDLIKHEIDKVDDDLKKWANGSFRSAFSSTNDNAIRESYTKIITWVYNHNKFSDVAKSDFAKYADGWIVAYALNKGYTVVTQEVYDPMIKRRVPIPNVCQEFNVPFVNTFEMLRRLGEKWTR